MTAVHVAPRMMLTTMWIYSVWRGSVTFSLTVYDVRLWVAMSVSMSAAQDVGIATVVTATAVIVIAVAVTVIAQARDPMHPGFLGFVLV